MSEASKRSSSHYFAVIYPCPSCGEKAGVSFDRTLCACGMMHHYCSACGVQADDCWDGAEASPTPERTEVERLRLALTRAMDRGNAYEEALEKWRGAYPVEVFPIPREEISAERLARLNTEDDPNASASMFAEWGRHIVACIDRDAQSLESSPE